MVVIPITISLYSWSPRGVLLNTVSGAQWLHSNKTEGIQPGGDIICKPYQFDGRSNEVKEPFFKLLPWSLVQMALGNF